MRDYLLTGGAGFLGWKVSELLLKRGNRVTSIDNLNDYYDPSLKRWRIKSLGARAGVRASLEDPWVYLDTNTRGFHY